MLFSFMGTLVPSLVVLLSSRPFGTCFIKPSGHLLAGSTCFIVASWTASLSALPLSTTATGSLSRAPSTRCRMLLLRCCGPSVLKPTAVFDELLLVTVLLTPRATSHPLWHRHHSSSLPASPCSSRLASRDPVPLAGSPAFTCCASGVVRCVRHQPPRNRGTLNVRCSIMLVCSPLLLLLRSASPPARLSELTLLNSPS